MASDSGIVDAPDAARDVTPRPDLAACVAIGDPCTTDSTCCDLGECGVQGTCRARPCTVSDDCGGLQCVGLVDSVEARGCAPEQCPNCDGQNWCHPTLGCTNRAPCSSTDSCAANEVCTADHICMTTCQSSADCGARECVALTTTQLADAADINAKVCAAPVCNCRSPDDYCSVDGLCVKEGSCQSAADCGDTRYGCDGVRCFCDDAQPDVCRFGCMSDADCRPDQLCDTVLRRCQTLYCAVGQPCPQMTACAPETLDGSAANICRRAGEGLLGEPCSAPTDCASAMCLNDLCATPCRQTADCPADFSCVFAGVWACLPVELGLCMSGCAPNEFCVAGNACNPFCKDSTMCSDGQQCVTGFGVYNCYGNRVCPENQIWDLFEEVCHTFCWTDADCANADCDEKRNVCRD